MQRLSAYRRALRDPDIGRLVNLTPAEVPQDVYRDVAEVVGVERKVVKQPVMTMPYGSSRRTWHKQVAERRPMLT